MKFSIKYLFVIFVVFYMFAGLSASADGQDLPLENKTVGINKIVKPKLLNFNILLYKGNITTDYNHTGNAYRRGVFMRVYTGDYKEPETWITNNLKLLFNGIDIPKKTHCYFFGSNVNNHNGNLNLVLLYETNTGSSTLFTGTGSENPVSITFPPQNYVYKLEKLKTLKNTLSNSPRRTSGLKVSWTSTTDDILVWLYNRGSVIKQLTSDSNKNYVVFPRPLFKPGENYKIRVRQKGGELALSGKFKAGTKILNSYHIWCDFKTK